MSDSLVNITEFGNDYIQSVKDHISHVINTPIIPIIYVIPPTPTSHKVQWIPIRHKPSPLIAYVTPVVNIIPPTPVKGQQDTSIIPDIKIIPSTPTKDELAPPSTEVEEFTGFSLVLRPLQLFP